VPTPDSHDHPNIVCDKILGFASIMMSNHYTPCLRLHSVEELFKLPCNLDHIFLELRTPAIDSAHQRKTQEMCKMRK
jgi:hypothetical protein